MIKYQIIRLADHPELKNRAAQWFSEKWSIPNETYLESIEESFNATVPSWLWEMVKTNRPGYTFINRNSR